MKILAVLLNPTIDQIYEIDNFKVGGTFKVNKSIIFPVGKAISCSLGINTLLKNRDLLKVLALIGKDEIPLYSKFLTQKNIDFQFIEVNGKTRSNKTINDSINHTTTHIRENGFDISENVIKQFINQLDAEIGTNDIVLFSGSLPPKTNDNFYKQLIKRSQQRGAITVLDTSGPPLIEGVKGKPTILKPNLVELSQILGNPKINELNLSEFEKSSKLIITEAKKLLGDELKIVLITLGDMGAIYVSYDQVLYGNVQVDGVLDTVGSGDAFLAGFISQYILKKTPVECFKTAIASGAANTLVSGPGIFQKKSVKALSSKVKIIELH